MKRKIIAITGIRSEYDILYPVINFLRKDYRCDLKIIVSGAHLSSWHGLTYKKIEEDGFEVIAKINSFINTDSLIQRPKAVGVLISALSRIIEKEQPHFLLVVGDREESIAAAVVGNYMNTLVVHIGGGDSVYGNADDPIRFAVSKLAHIHFVLSNDSLINLLKVGEERFRIFNVGNPSLDNIRATSDMHFPKISTYLDFDIKTKEYLMFIKHPLSSEKKDSYPQMKISLEAVEKFCKKNNLKAVGIYPNTDPGSRALLEIIDTYKKSDYVRFYKTLPREIFINLMKNCLVLVGNSSMGILETPFYQIPVVNIGNRQKGRFNAGNVEFVEHEENKIVKSLHKACFNKIYRKRIFSIKNPFGDGHAAEKIRNILLSVDVNDKKWYIKKKLC